MAKIVLFCLLCILGYTSGQRITTIHLEGVQYFISRMNPYSPELNYFLAYQYCRSLGLQLASFETKEKAESMTTYLKNAGYGNYDFWTSGNRLGTGMFLWMSTGLPFNATFDFFENSADAIQGGLLDPVDHNSNTSPQRTARDSSSGAEKGCVILKQPALKWMPEDCSAVKDFICEQTRCYYYNYGSIPVSSAQGRPITSTTSQPDASLTNPHSSTTPLPIVMSTYASFVKKVQQGGESQPSFVSLKLDHERALESEADGESEEHNDDNETDGNDHVNIQEADTESYDEHARELIDDKEHVLSLSVNELHHEDMQAMEELHQQLQGDSQEYDKHALVDAEISDDDDPTEETAAFSSENDSLADTAKENPPKSLETLTAPSTSSDVPAVEVRLKQISQEIEKLASNDNHHHFHNGVSNHDNDDIGRQSFLSLTDLIRTLRPNAKQIIPQIDSDYSNAMRVLGESSSMNDDESLKLKEANDTQQPNRAYF